MSAPRGGWPLPCGTDLGDLVRQVERVPLPARLDQAIMLRVRRAMFLAAAARFFNGLLPRLGWALLTYTGLARPQRGEAR
jgi:hypothetical protein